MVKANIELVVKANDLASGKLQGIGNKMKGMSTTFRKAGIGMMGVGVALGGGLLAMAKKTADMGDEIAKMSKRTGFAVETLSELRHVAQLSGTELGSIEKATKRMSGTILDAQDGMETYIRAFEHLGIKVEELAGLSPEEQFWKISYALGDLEDQTVTVALAQDIFGRAGTELLPMLASGSEAIADMRAEAHELGVVFDKEAAAEAEAMKDALQNLETAMGGVAKELVDTLLPDITKFAEKMVEIIGDVKDWIEQNPKLVEGLKTLVGVLLAGGGILFALSQISKAIILVNTALAIFHGLAGPAGWIKLAAGMAIAGGAIAGMMGLMGGFKTPRETYIDPETGIPAPKPMRYGGIVTSPTQALIGEAGPEAVIPLSGGGLGETIHIHLDLDGTEVADVVYERLLQRKGRNNTLELA